MSKTKFYYKVLVVILGILLFPGLTYAERDYVAELESLSDGDAVMAFIKSLNEDELLVMGNQACIKDPRGEVASWVVIYHGLGPIWDQNPPQADKYFSIIQDKSLDPLWRRMLIGAMDRYMDYWSYKDTERLINYSFECLKNPKEQIVLRRGYVSNLGSLTYKMMQIIVESKELSIDEKRRQIDKLHLKAALIIEYLVRLVQEGVEKDDQLLQEAVGTLRAFASLYISQKDTPLVEYRTGWAFDTAVKAATGIGPAFVQVLQRKDVSVVLIGHTVESLISLDLLDQIPSNLIANLKKDPRFSSEKDQDSLNYWEQKIREERSEKRSETMLNGQNGQNGQRRCWSKQDSGLDLNRTLSPV